VSWDRIEGQWKQGRGKAMHHWGTMMNDELAAIAGKYEEIVGRLQEKYGIAKEEAKSQVEEYKKAIEQLRKSHSKLIEMQKALSKQKKVDRKPVKSIASQSEKPRFRTKGLSNAKGGRHA
jgi:uncharacterized protein YjbJ (UPF0337 family)